MKRTGFFSYARSFGFPPRVAGTVIGLSLVGTVFEGIGLSMLLPVFQFIQAGGDLAKLTADQGIWPHIIAAYDRLGLPVDLAVLLGTSFVCILVRQVFVYARLLYLAYAKQNFGFRIRNLGFNLYLSASASYQEHTARGEIVNDLTTELQSAIGCLFGTLMLASYGVLGLVYVAIMFGLSVQMTVATLVVGAVVALSISRLFRSSERLSHRVVQANRGMSAFLLERLGAARLIRLSGTEAAEAAAMSRLTARQRDTLIGIARLLARLEVIVEPLVVGLGFAFLYFGIAVFGLGLSEIGLFLLIVLRLLPILKEALRQRQSVLATMGSLEGVHRRLENMRAAQDVESGTRPFRTLDHEIRFEDLRFSYGGNAAAVPALAGVRAIIPAHRMTAIAGPSGAGKSTLVDMLPRLRDPDSGAILFDGVPIGEYRLAELRAGIAYVPQSPQIFNVSPAEHIRYGKADASMAEIQAAARLAGADTFIEALAEGYDTLLGEGGQRLSGGQRQRLDLARALVRQAPILIMDEPTSNLDADSELAFREALERVRGKTDITVLVIGHRLSTIAHADNILVMCDGKVVEHGSHDELLTQAGWYAQAWRKQGGETRESNLAAVSAQRGA
jgi:subfamily B ATP-binding cassette protein MsbA